MQLRSYLIRDTLCTNYTICFEFVALMLCSMITYLLQKSVLALLKSKSYCMVTFSKISVHSLYKSHSFCIRFLPHFSFKRWRSLISVLNWNFNVTIQGNMYVDSQYCTINLLTFYLGTTWKKMNSKTASIIQNNSYTHAVAKADELKEIIKTGDGLMSSIRAAVIHVTSMFGIV